MSTPNRAAWLAEDIAYFLTLVRYDWLVSRAWNRLHHATFTDDQLDDVAEYGMAVRGPVRLSCGRTASFVSIPGFITRMGALRCTGCCRALGYPVGKGSPKNDDACRALIGLATNTETETSTHDQHHCRA